MFASRISVAALLVLTLLSTAASASVTSVTINNSHPYEKAAGYTYAEITMAGTVARTDGTTGNYRVPAVVIYPASGNGIGVVDWLNSAFYHFFPPSTEFGTFQFTLLSTDNYLFENGYTYASVQWNKAVTEIFGPTMPNDGAAHNWLVYGTIEKSADAWEIFSDAARLLKNPSAFPAANRPRAVNKVISSGYSQGAGLQLEMLVEGFDPTNAYDAHLATMMGYACWKRDNVAPYFGSVGTCRASVPAHSQKVIYLASQTDMIAFHSSVLGAGQSAFYARDASDPNWRQYEIAGASHIPKSVVDLGVANQNSADAKPVFRAAIANLTAWLAGTEPPASCYFNGSIGADGNFAPATDSDGNWRGGLRLPHVDSIVDGKPAGAVTGVYGGLNTAGLDPFHVFVLLGGTYTQFSDATIASLYPTHGVYVSRVTRAANYLKNRRYILPADAEVMVRAAAEAKTIARRPANVGPTR